MKILLLLIVSFVSCFSSQAALSRFAQLAEGEETSRREVVGDLIYRPASSDDTVVVKSAHIYFPIGSEQIDPAFHNNDSVLHDISLAFQTLQAPENNFRIDSVVVIGSASPLGGEALNRVLSFERALSLADYLKHKMAVQTSALIVRSVGANWQALRRMVAASSMRYKKEVLDIIDRVPVNQRRNYVLMNLKWGRPYREMMETFFPDLQNSSMLMVYCSRKLPVQEDIHPVTVNPAERMQEVPDEIATAVVPAEEPQAVAIDPKAGYPMLNLSTNLLYWAALAPNIGVEYCLPWGHASVNGEFFMPWWKNSAKHKYYQIRQFSGEGRYWFNGDGQFRGHFLGAYGNGGIYDLENGKTGYKGNFWGAGATYGYVLRIKPRFRMEFSVGVGFLSTKYEQYIPVDNHSVYEKTVKTGYIGPTKVKVGLVWTLMQRNKSRRK